MERGTIQAQMFAFIEAWQSSGQRQTVYCQQHNMAPARFYYWLKQYKAAHGREPQAAGFCKVTVNAMETTRSQEQVWMTLELANGRRMFFHQPLEYAIIERLLF